MILGKAITTNRQPAGGQDITNFDLLIWQPAGAGRYRAEINSMFYVEKELLPFGLENYNVYKRQGNFTSLFARYLNSGGFKLALHNPPGMFMLNKSTNQTPPIYTPPVIPPITPAVDPAPGSNTGAGDLVSWFKQNQLYVYGAAAIIAAAFFLKK